MHLEYERFRTLVRKAYEITRKLYAASASSFKEGGLRLREASRCLHQDNYASETLCFRSMII